MKSFNSNMEKDSPDSANVRKVIYTNKYLQIVLMNLKPGEEIGEKVHIGVIQFFQFKEGKGKCIVDGNEYCVENGDAIAAPAGAKSNVINTDAERELKMYTIYTPPDYKDGSINYTTDVSE